VQALIGAFLFVAEATPGRAQCEPAIEFVSDRTQSPTRAAHAIAFSGSALGLIKIEPVAGPLYFALYDLDLRQISPDRKLAESFVLGSADLFWTGSEFGFFYETNGQLILQRISASGDLIGGPIAIPLRTALTTRDHDVAFDPTRGAYVIVHSVTQGADRGVWLTFVSPSGDKTREELLTSFVVSFDAEPRVAIAGNGTIGVLYRNSLGGNLRLVRFSPSNMLQSDTILDTTDTAPLIAANDTEFAIVFRKVMASRSTLTWLRINSNGVVVLPETELLVGSGVDVAAVDFLWNPDLEEWALAYVSSAGGFAIDQGEYRLRRFRAEDDVIDDALFSPNPLRKVFLGRNSFVWTGRAYVSPADLPIAQGVTESYLLGYCPFQVIAETDRRNVNAGTNISFSAQAAGGTPPYTYLWNFGDGSEQGGRTVQHVFSTPGVYTVTVTATDANGVTITDTQQVSVLRPKRRAVRK
jgi:hypothetical protein